MTAVIGVRIIPGTTALTRTPSGPSSNAIVWGDPHYPVLRRGIGETVGHASDPGRRAEVHDCRRRLRFLHGTGESLAHVKRAFEVDRQDLPPNLGVGIQNVADSPDASAVDQPREFSEPPNGSGHERGHLVPVRNVNADAIDPLAVPEFGHHLIDLFFPHVCGADRCTFCKESPDANRADTAAGASYQD